MRFRIIQNRKFYFTFSGLLMLISVLALIFWGLNLGIDFTGGSLMEIKYSGQKASIEEVRQTLSEFDLGEMHIQPVGENGFLLRFKDIDQATKEGMTAKLKSGQEQVKKIEAVQAPTAGPASGGNEIHIVAESAGSDINVERFESVGPTIGLELQRKAVLAIVLALLGIIAYIAWAFRKISLPVASWKYGLGAILALIHDILIATGIFIVIGHFLGWEADILFITALLTILGFSVHDTIVVYDRIRENLTKKQSDNFEETVNTSVNETMTRSINTSLTTVLVLAALYVLGGESIKQFIFVLLVGITIGTYSSIFIASPLMVVFEKLRHK